MCTALVAMLFFAACAACGHSQSSPTQPSGSQTPAGPAEALVVRLDVTVDESRSRDPIALLSEVTADASVSPEAGTLTYSIDFGDGTKVSGPAARHVYEGPGTFKIICEVRDSQGRTAVASQQVSVKTLTGAWFHAGYVSRDRKVEVRRLTVTGQEGLALRGVYQVTGAPDRTFTGLLTKPRNVIIVVDSQVTLEGTIPGRLNQEEENWTLLMRGDSVDGERFDFRPIVGDATPQAPDAVLRVRFDNFDAPIPIAGLSPVQFDGSTSRGTKLAHFIEFGDGQVSTESRAIHTINESPREALTARLTVVDGFGRSDSESITYSTFELHWFPGDGWFFADLVNRFLRFDFTTRNGPTYEGFVLSGYTSQQWTPFVAVMSGERDVHIVAPKLGLEFRGYIVMSSPFAGRMILTQSGGADDGRTWTLIYDDGPG
jgi:hypothetical protein